MNIEIKCPKCKWEPDGGAYWSCANCHHTWNTFDTQAVCPKCNNIHNETQCIKYKGGCNKVSPHEDWYSGLDKMVDELMEEVEKTQLVPLEI